MVLLRLAATRPLCENLCITRQYTVFFNEIGAKLIKKTLPSLCVNNFIKTLTLSCHNVTMCNLRDCGFGVASQNLLFQPLEVPVSPHNSACFAARNRHYHKPLVISVFTWAVCLCKPRCLHQHTVYGRLQSQKRQMPRKQQAP